MSATIETSFNPALTPGLYLWMRAYCLAFTDTGATTPPANTNTIAVLGAAGYGDTNYGRNGGGAGTFATGQQNGLPAIQGDGANILTLDRKVVLAGKFTVYFTFKRATNKRLYPFGGSGAANDAPIFIYSDNNVYSRSNGTQVGGNAFTGNTTWSIARARRDGSNNVKFAATGMSEITLTTTLSDTINVGALLGNGGQVSDTTAYIGEALLVADYDLPTDFPQVDRGLFDYLRRVWAIAYP